MDFIFVRILLGLDNNNADFDYKQLHKQLENHASAKPPFKAFCIIVLLVFAQLFMPTKAV